MLTMSLPDTLTTLLTVFASCFTQPTFRTFQALVAGFLAQPGPRTVTGMLVGAGLAGRRHHDLGYRFFASARWSADQLGLVLLDLITQTLVPPGAPIVLATDDTLWRRTGRKLSGTAWHHDGGGPGRHRPAWGHRWVVVGVILNLPFFDRAVCLPILVRLWIPGDPDRTPLQLARELLNLAVARLGGRPVHLVGDAAYIGKPLQGLPAHVTVTARLRCDAALYQPAPPRTGRPGRPRVKGDRLPELIVLAAMSCYRWTLSGCAAMARPWTGRCWPCAACGTARWAASPSRSCSAARSAPVTATSWPWSPPTLPPPPPRSSNATPLAGQQSRRSLTPVTWSASARPAPAPSARWSAWSPSAFAA
jgi:hypothetical protein